MAQLATYLRCDRALVNDLTGEEPVVRELSVTAAGSDQRPRPSARATGREVTAA